MWQPWPAAPRTLRPPRGPRSRLLKRDTTPLLTWSAARRRSLRQYCRVWLHRERNTVPWRPQRRRNIPRNLPTGYPLAAGGDPEGAAGVASMIVSAETTVHLIAGPTAPRRGMMSHDRRGVPPGALPPPLEVATVPLPDATTAPAVSRPTTPPRGGPVGGGTTLTGADVGHPAQTRPGAYAMIR